MQAHLASLSLSNPVSTHEHRVIAPDGQVRWELSPTDAGTVLRLIHSETADITHALGWSDALISIQRLIDGPLGPNDRVLGHAGAGGRARQRASTPK